MSVCKFFVWGAIFFGVTQLSICPSVQAAVVLPPEIVAPHVKSTIPGGRVSVFAQVISGGCTLSVSNTDKFVHMGEVRSNQFAGVGSDAAAVPFSIQLDECSSNVSESVAVAFSGVVSR